MGSMLEAQLIDNTGFQAKDEVLEPNCVTSWGLGSHPDVEALLNIKERDPSDTREVHAIKKSSGASENGSCNAPLEQKDPMKVWQEMKKNGFLSLPASQPILKKHVRKCTNDMAKTEMLSRKMKVAKIEQIDRFPKVSAPSGLLDDLNPGIINRLRNRKQVYSIIQALVRSVELENTQSKQQMLFREEIKDCDLNECSNALPCGSQVSGWPMYPTRPIHMDSEKKVGVDDLSVASRKSQDHRNDKEEVKLRSSGTTVSENANSADETMLTENINSQEESEDNGVVSPFDPKEHLQLIYISSCFRIANLASQWLGLLCRDIRGRLAALRQSRMRVKDVLQIELPLLISEEFSPIKENEQFSAPESSMSIILHMHQARWTALFDQMDKVLHEEMNRLEIWLNQVEEVHLLHRQRVPHADWYSRNDISSSSKA
ncbi:hypothetical protein F2P56_032191 [Juglans regia]|uniref:Uncharacterized protein LOC108996975 isoform X1 n=2 Tax=Juglans regia TaxID=51240 RepID=A0A2I4FAB3_JUGRE|nr:uncharacterized protein LOC108996975 isoform X1 [Juglans regia]XP_035540848.1 uncharacterized protein LOC108996975 isoform X1 [Juglans regia]KAF5446573.1 hypothetical protein F2P56_032191 [Juglans regia]